MDRRLRGGQVELHKLTPYLLHRNPFCFMGLWVTLVCCVIEARTGAAAELFGAERRDIYEKKAVRDGRSRLDRFLGLRGLFRLRRFKFHNGLGYRNLR